MKKWTSLLGRVRTGQVVSGDHGAREVILALVVLLPGKERNDIEALCKKKK